MLWLLRSWRRKRLAKEPFPETWRAIVEKRFSFFASLEEPEQDRFLAHLYVFAKEKHFIGVKGVEVTDEMRVLVSGAAARISRNLSLDAYDRLTEILIYPSHYVHEGRDGIVLGEAHHWGTVVLSWDAVEQGIRVPDDGHDTAIHEFAHVLDVADGTFDGTPELHRRADYLPWSQVLSRRFKALKRAPNRNVLRAYGATNEAEFFAVATEAFFEKPDQLKRSSPDLYEELARFYRSAPKPSKPNKKRRLGRRR